MYACLMYNVYAADSPQCGRNDGHFVVIQQSDETSDDPGIDHFLDSLVDIDKLYNVHVILRKNVALN